MLGLVRSVLRTAHRKGHIRSLPDLSPAPVPEKPPKFLSEEDYAAMLAAARKLRNEGDWRPMVMLLLGADCGLRRGEMLALRMSDIDLKQGRIMVRHSVSNGELRPPKGKRFRVVAISGELHELMTKHAPKSGFILRTEAGKPATAKAVNVWFASLTRLAGVSTAGKAHVLRHTFGTHLAMAGVDLHRIQSLLGHSDQRTTELYARIAGTHAATASDELTRFRARARRNSGEK